MSTRDNTHQNASPIRPETPDNEASVEVTTPPTQPPNSFASTPEHLANPTIIGASFTDGPSLQQPQTPPFTGHLRRGALAPASAVYDTGPGPAGIADTHQPPLIHPLNIGQRRPLAHPPSLSRPQPRFPDVETPAFVNPWPAQDGRRDGPGRPDVSKRCPHDLAYPCFCRNNTEMPGVPCMKCRFPLCSYNSMLQVATVDALELELARERARGRGSHQFEQEITLAINHAREREREEQMERRWGLGRGPEGPQ
ncbi:hypothetical protein CKAH01_17883 [Colletotrichum kahawae]|uniref:Uncharacterized protein n=1 Tax=Colletotrichum kahawae TaxID=34407 RepID=A0AAD9Y9Z9_COLKA|nr:hypothetical protein CKAH01_17883 [Colletotrichum kahawae]